MSDIEIPESPEKITSEWLTQMLRTTNVIQQSQITSFDTIPIGIGFGFVGRIVRLVLNYDVQETNAPQSLVAKFPSVNPAQQRYWNVNPLSNMSHYEKENYFYETLAPQTKLQTPKYYYSAIDNNAHRGILILEDLTQARTGDQVSDCPLSDAKTVLRDMAQFHADFWSEEKLDTIIGLPTFNAGVEGLQARFVNAWDSFVEQFGSQLSDKILYPTQKLMQHGIAIRNQLTASPRTLIHGDFRLDNLIFKPSKEGETTVVLDWTGFRGGTCLWDVNQFICQCFGPRDRQEHEWDLLKFYHDILASHGIHEYSYDQLAHDYRLTTFLTWIKIVRANEGLETNVNERSRKLATTVINRVSTALLDHYSDDLMPQ